MEKTFTFKSSDNMNTVSGICWNCTDEPKGILQIVHGMSENISRYASFAEFMASKGFVVIGHDHLGHGHTAASTENLGYFGTVGSNAYVVEDIHKVTLIAKERYPHLPLFILGHSMGSFLTRQYLHTYADEELQGAIIMGSGQNPKLLISFGKFLAGTIASFRGEKYRSKLLWKMSNGSFNKKFKPVKTPVDWLSRDEDVCKNFCKDSLCNFIFTASAYREMFAGMLTNYDHKNLKKINKNLPILIISGSEDPVGNFGKAPPAIEDDFKSAGIKKIRTKLFENGRHEILNEINKQEVFEYIYEFISNCNDTNKACN